MQSAEQAADAILALINSRPRNPTSAEIAAVIRQFSPQDAAEETPLAAQIRAAMAAKEAADEACAKPLDGPAFDEAEALCDQRRAELLVLARRIPSPPHTLEHVALLAELAFHFAVRDRNGRMEELEDDDMFMLFSARLIEAVLQFRKRPGGCGAIAARRQEWCALLADWNAKAKITDDGTEDAEAALSAADDRLTELEDEMSAQQASTSADVGMLAEILYRRTYSSESGLLHDGDSDKWLAAGPNGSGGIIDDAMATLLKAIRDLTMAREKPRAT
jgi:hypothetical protein